MLASIDVGSNTVRMLLGRVDDQGRLIPLRYERAITRLGGDFVQEIGLAPESMERTLLALKGFSEILREHPPESIRMAGTAALRRAANRNEFIDKVKQQTGLDLEVIEGQEEAHFSALGVLEALDPKPSVSLIIDIGGGSTELVLLQGSTICFRESYPLGVVRLCEEHNQRSERRNIIDETISRFEHDLSRAGCAQLIQSKECEFVGTAGTVTTLAAMDQQMANYDWRKINNYLLPLKTLELQYEMLAPMNVSERENLTGLEVGRGDLVMPGIEIITALAVRFSRPHIRVSDFGLLEGLLLDLSTSSID